jgi:hypothetical protein
MRGTLGHACLTNTHRNTAFTITAPNAVPGKVQPSETALRGDASEDRAQRLDACVSETVPAEVQLLQRGAAHEKRAQHRATSDTDVVVAHVQQRELVARLVQRVYQLHAVLRAHRQ